MFNIPYQYQKWLDCGSGNFDRTRIQLLRIMQIEAGSIRRQNKKIYYRYMSTLTVKTTLLHHIERYHYISCQIKAFACTGTGAFTDLYYEQVAYSTHTQVASTRYSIPEI